MTAAAEQARKETPTEFASEGVAIALDPHRPGVERARLVDSGIAVWALIGYMGGEEGGPTDNSTPAS